ncbi:unnamed protein product [Timema podura]|uniref:CHCH domain-containing protein n=1 Tax=Timema podura TaxID=61482 RepID=A0ABN7PA12_TIMPD|nr:unnamed protein product [Timema podura]
MQKQVRYGQNRGAMRGTGVLARNARAPQKEPVPFQQLLPLKLKNSVSGKGERTSNVACLQEMAVMFACLKRSEFDQALCSKEITSFQSCYNTSQEQKKAKKELDRSDGPVLGAEARFMGHKKINQLLRKFPQ